MTFKPHGKNLIKGKWIGNDQTFSSSPASGPAYQFSIGSAECVDTACQAAEVAFWSFGYISESGRAIFLHTIADEIEARADAITTIAMQETGLPIARLQNERVRTTNQLRLFAEHILQGNYLDHRHDEALPERQPLPRPELHMLQRPIGPVAVFGASNFPLAFSTAGGDTASAFAAGCPVIVKSHAAHPGTGEVVAEAINAARQKCQLDPGIFAFIQDDSFEVGTALVQHPLINAVGFTGSLRGGRTLFDLCVSRPEPIPFFGELGSINPIFVLPTAMSTRTDSIANGWVESLTLGAGQFCTNPGIIIVLRDQHTDAFIETTKHAAAQVVKQVMLTDAIASAYQMDCTRIVQIPGIYEVFTSICNERLVTLNILQTTAANWLKHEILQEEVFGPLGIIVIAESIEEMRAVALGIQGQLTCTLQMDDRDLALARSFMVILERKAGRLLVNGFPTGVEVAGAMVHSGPYPASTNFGATSVGTLAIRRFLRPVCYQNLPEALLNHEST
jgi:alpha-ketoglutaric semialdehyde dehydrogenase